MVEHTPRTSPVDIDAALANPTAYFDQPQDVLEYSGMSNAFKLRLLRQWEHDARRLAEAEGEGMGGGEESMLGRVHRALRTLEARTNETGADVVGGLGEAVSHVQHAASRAQEGVTEFRAFMRAQPIAGALLMVGIGYLVGRIAGGRR